MTVIDAEKLDELLVTHPDQARVQNTLTLELTLASVALSLTLSRLIALQHWMKLIKWMMSS